MMNLTVLAFVLYFIAMLAIGVYFFAKPSSNGEKDYFLGGRKMGPWVTAMSAQASDMSAWLLMGLPGSMIAFGFGKAWIGIGLCIGTILNWLLVAKRLRKFTKASGDSITLPQYLTNRFAAKSPALKIICAVVFLISFTIYVASAFSAGAKVFVQLFPTLSPDAAIILFAAIILAYTFLGGFSAVCWTDFFQGLLMLIALLAVPIVIIASGNTDTSLLNNVITNTKDGTTYTFVANFFNASPQDIISGLAWGLGYFGMPHILVRFMSIEKPSMVKKSAMVAIVWVILSLGAAIAIAYLGRMFILNGEPFAESLLSAGQQELIFVKLAKSLFTPFVAGILLAAIIAASMSTADSQLLVASSSFTSDLYKPIFRKNASDKELLWVGRLIVVVVAVIAFFIASGKGEGAQAIMDMVGNAWGLFGAAFGPVIILSLFWRRFTYKGALAGIVSGAVVDIFWLTSLSYTGIYEILPGFIVGMVCAVIVTLLDNKPSDEILTIYASATDNKIDD